MAIATQEVFSHTDALVETWDLDEATPARTLVASEGRFGVSLTDTVEVTKPAHTLYGDVKITGLSQPGVGNDQADAIGKFAAGVAVDGTWEFGDITGVTATTDQGTPVYVTSTGELTTTKGTNDRVGVVNYNASFVRAAGVAPIKIGA